MAEIENVHEVQLTRYKAKSTEGTLKLGTEDSYGVEKIHITRDSWWDGLTVTATFRIGNTKIRVPFDGDSIQVPQEATGTAGKGVIVFTGSDGFLQVITRNLNYQVEKHDPVEGDAPNPTPDVWTQFVAQTKTNADAASASAASAASAAGTAQSAATQAAQSAAGIAGSVSAAQSAAEDAEEAKNAAETAKTQAQTAAGQVADSVGQAANSAQQAAQSASSAQGYASQASGSASTAGTAASTATSKAQDAQTAAEQAADSAAQAAQSAASITGSVSAAQSAAEDAEEAKTAAETARTAAEDAAERAEQIADFDPADFATAAQGAKADSAVQSVNGVEPDASGNVQVDTGAGTVKSVNGKDPDGDGNVQLTAADVGAATASHSHAASDISSGTLPVSRGGTGASTASAARSQLGAAPVSHASSGTSYGRGTNSMYGHVKLSDTASTSNGVSSGVAATPACVANAVAAARIGYDIYTGVIDNLYEAINGGSTSISYEVPLNRDATGDLTDYSVLVTVEGQNTYDALGVTACVQSKSGGGFYIMLYNNSSNRATVKAISWLVLIPHRT